MKTALLILNGEKPSQELVNKFWNEVNLRICADGGADVLANYNLFPDVIAGDMDSVNKETLNKFSKISKILLTDQDKSDAEKVIEYCAEKNIKKIRILGGLGKRVDHTLYNLSLLKKFFGICELVFYSENEKIYIVNGSCEFIGMRGKTISILPIFGEVKNVTSFGLRYPLNDQILEISGLISLSNVIDEERSGINFLKGFLLISVES